MSSFTPPAGSLHEFVDGSAFSRICAGLLATSAIRAIISHRLDSSRVGISTFFLGALSPNHVLASNLPGDYRPPRESAKNSRAPAPISNCRKKQAPVVCDDTHTTGVIQMGAMPAQQPHERNQAPSKSSICGTDFLPNSMVCCASDAASAPGRVMTMHGTLITLNLSLSSGKCAIS